MGQATGQDKIYMQRCIELAMNGSLQVAPNPMVGCVIVHNNIIIGEGYHQIFGGPHAEVNAINSVKDPGLLQASVLYVNLEPCAHHGKTPPCADLIIAKGIKRVVIGQIDPNEKVAGKGIEKLAQAGCQVITGVLKEECYQLNKMFFTFHTLKRPYVILKWAESADSFIDKIRDKADPVGPNWITGEKSRMLVHKWRAECQAIMVGTNTIEKDNPGLDVRLWEGHCPVRIVIDRDLRLSPNSRVFAKNGKCLVFTCKKETPDNHIEYITVKEKTDMTGAIMKTLYQKGIISVFVEGGAVLLQSFIDAGLWDEARVFRGQALFNQGIKAPVLSQANRKCLDVFHEQLVLMYNHGIN